MSSDAPTPDHEAPSAPAPDTPDTPALPAELPVRPLTRVQLALLAATKREQAALMQETALLILDEHGVTSAEWALDVANGQLLRRTHAV